MTERFRPVTTRSRLLVLLAGGERDNLRLAKLLGVSRSRVYQLRDDMADEAYRNSTQRGRPANPGSLHAGQRYLQQSAQRRGISVVALRRAIIDTIVNDRLIDAVLDDDTTTGSAAVSPSPRCGEPGPAPVSPSGAGLRGFNERSMRA